MNPVLLIAINFLRQRRWFVLIYPLLAIAFSAMMLLPGSSPDTEELTVYFTQLSIYAVLIAIMMAAQADFNERKSRRILSLLSKGIERRDYLAGLLAGVVVSSGLFLAGAAVGMLWMASSLSLRPKLVLEAALLMWLSCCLCAALTIFLATFLHPLLAMAGASFLAGIGLAAHLIRIPGGILFPIADLNLAAKHLLVHEEVSFQAVPVAIVEIVIFWLLAGLIFERRDIAVAIE